jgi:hypothetical protein
VNINQDNFISRIITKRVTSFFITTLKGTNLPKRKYPLNLQGTLWLGIDSIRHAIKWLPFVKLDPTTIPVVIQNHDIFEDEEFLRTRGASRPICYSFYLKICGHMHIINVELDLGKCI